LKIAVRAGADPGFEVRGTPLFEEAGGLGAALRYPVGPERSPGGIQGAKLLDFRDFVGLKTYFPRSKFYYFSVIISGVKVIKLLKIYKFLD
jgi:hypothetical protein